MLKSINIILLFSCFLLFRNTQAQCNADVGTFQSFYNGSSFSSFPTYIYPGESFEILSDNNFTLPPNTIGEVSELFVAILECAPTQTDPRLDACWTGSWWTNKDFSDNNSPLGTIISNFGYGRYFLNTITVDDGDDNLNSNNITGLDNNADNCFDFDPSQAVETYWLREISAVWLNGCNDGTVRIVASGGLPEFDANGSTYVVTNNGAGTVTDLPTSHNQAFHITGLNVGDNYSIHITDINGKVSTVVSGTYTEVSSGDDASIITCSNDPNFNMYDKLGGTPTPGGTWRNSSGSTVSNSYNPGSGGGNFTYTVTHPQNPICRVNAVLSITEFIGTSTVEELSISFCETDGNATLFSYLPATAQAGGSWLSPDGSSFSGTFNPSSSTTGTYTYSENTTNPCDAITYLLDISVSPEPNAGNDASTYICSDDLPLQASSLLNGTPDAGGTWLDPSGHSFNGTLTTSNSTSGSYKYIVSSPPCTNDTSTLNLTYHLSSDEDYNTSITLCEIDNNRDIYFLLAGSPTGGGFWTDPVGANSNGIITPASSPSGRYTYNNPTSNPCNFDHYTVDVTINNLPSSGNDGNKEICDNDNAFDLFFEIPGSPDAGGQFITPLGTSFNGNISPQNAAPGSYSYITQTDACPNDTSFFALTIHSSPLVSLKAEVTLEPNDTYTFNTTASNYNSFSWSKGDFMDDSNILTPTISPDDQFVRETYTLTLNNANCSKMASTTITVYRLIEVPTGFTPNNDGINDVWEVDNLKLYPDADVTVLNRYGTMVYQGKGSDEYWNGTRNGKPLPAGTYFFVIEVGPPKEQKVNGTVTIVK